MSTGAATDALGERISLSEGIEEILAERNQIACCEALATTNPARLLIWLSGAGRAVGRLGGILRRGVRSARRARA